MAASADHGSSVISPPSSTSDLSHPAPTWARLDGMVEHAELLCARMGEEHGIRDFRKHTGWYLKGFPAGGEMRARSTWSVPRGDAELIGSLDRETPFPVGGMRMVRGHSGSPKDVIRPRVGSTTETTRSRCRRAPSSSSAAADPTRLSTHRLATVRVMAPPPWRRSRTMTNLIDGCTSPADLGRVPAVATSTRSRTCRAPRTSRSAQLPEGVPPRSG